MTDTTSTTTEPASVTVPFAGINEQIARLVRHADEYRAVLDEKLGDPAVRLRPSSLFAAHCLAEAESGQLRHALDLAEMEVRDATTLLDEAIALLRRTSMAAGFYAERAHQLEEALAQAAGVDIWEGRRQ
ncbi:hypothetical protein JHL17_34075 [Azospirillum sp. YIM B02556]|uniref:Uncharacterized protein n=1 Tax=Azospirillum endophyticum TaxID=2800326 RepID=A0ABS1FG65_9PROT|nr:hypothetical protein [Azospirillum endophyticum]MBK1842435.1 hypothetical protein [Azospirillum endophyticum]